jgi:predicted phosphohydrolase
MSLFTIGDLHLSFGTDKPMDIFSGWSGYVEKIENNWRRLINDEDTVVIPGDISWAMDLNSFKNDAEYLNNLPGNKIILKGNHDYWWTTLSKMNSFLAENKFDKIKIVHNNAICVGNICVCGTRGWFYDETQMIDKKVLIREVGRLETSIKEALKTGLEPVVFLHYPPVYSNFECTEIMEVLQKYNIKRCFYGHLHGNAVYKSIDGIYKDINFRLVSCDYLDFTPIIIEK